MGEEQATLEYPANFKATLETIELPDTRLSNVWGKQIYRVSLTDTQKKTEGSYKFIVK